MKFMKLGNRPDTFVTTESVRTIASEVPRDFKIQVENCTYLLHKFPLLSKCLRLQALAAGAEEDGGGVVRLRGFPGGAATFESCAKFCYGITITVSAATVVPLRLAADYLGMAESADRNNLAGKLDAFLSSILLRRWSDTVAVLRAAVSPEHASRCEELAVTARCIDAAAAMIASATAKPSWPTDIAELNIDVFFRIMLAAKASPAMDPKAVGDALKAYARRWLLVAGEGKGSLLLEKMVSLIPPEKGAVSCSFILKLLKAASLLSASPATKEELCRRAALQLDEATVADLTSSADIAVVTDIVRDFMQLKPESSPPASPPPALERRRRSRSSENVVFEGSDAAARRSSSSSSHSAMLKVAKVVDGYLLAVAGDAGLEMRDLVGLATAVPEFARPVHDDLYRVIDIYLQAHPGLEKRARKQLCRVLDCRKLSVAACVHAAQNDMLPLRVVVQVLFFEQAASKKRVGDIQAMLAGVHAAGEDAAGGKKLETLQMKLEEEEDDEEEAVGFGRSASARLMSFCALPASAGKKKMSLGKLWPVNRSCSRERH